MDHLDAAQIDPLKVDPDQAGIVEDRPGQGGVFKRDSGQSRARHIRAAQVCTIELDINQLGLVQFCIDQNSSPQISPFQDAIG